MLWARCRLFPSLGVSTLTKVTSQSADMHGANARAGMKTTLTSLSSSMLLLLSPSLQCFPSYNHYMSQLYAPQMKLRIAKSVLKLSCVVVEPMLRAQATLQFQFYHLTNVAVALNSKLLIRQL